MYKNLLPAAAAIIALSLVPSAYAEDSNMDYDTTPVPHNAVNKNADGGINTGTGTIPDGGMHDKGMENVDAPPNGDTDTGGGINSGPAGSLRSMDVIPSGNSH